MNDRMRHFLVKLLCDEMECKDISEVAGFMFRREGNIMPEPVAGADGYIYDDMVLARAEWDRTNRPYAFMRFGSGKVSLYSSATPFGYSGSSVLISPPYSVSTYDRATNSWGEASEVTEGINITVSSTYAMWSNHTIATEDGTVVFKGTTPKAFYLNDPNTPTAFLTSGGSMTFQKDSTGSKGFYAAFVGWDTTTYSSTKMPWLRIDKDTISQATINADAIPESTDYWFYNCPNFARVYLPEGMKKIGKYMFSKTQLLWFSFPSTLEEIGTYAYANLLPDNLLSGNRTSINIPDSVKKIGDYAFYNADVEYAPHCVLTIGEGCEEIGRYAFGSNSPLSWVNIGSKVKRILPYAFYRIGIDRAGVSSTQDVWPKITFNNPNGWWVSTDANAGTGISVDVSDDASLENARLLAAVYYGGIWSTTLTDGQYCGYYWNRTLSEDEIDDIVVERYPDAAGADKMFLKDENGNLTRCYLYNNADTPFTITEYDSETTEFKATGWLRVAYHTTGEYARQVTIDDFRTTASEGWNYLKNIRETTRGIFYYNGEQVWPTKPSSADNYLAFASADPFTIATYNSTKNWDGLMYYSTDAETWKMWDGTTAIESAERGGEHQLYVCGKLNSTISSGATSKRWVLSGSNISCNGNIENLLDYEVVFAGGHPSMAENCYSRLFYQCANLVKAPELKATTMTKYCYAYMFYQCTNLTEPPALPATALAEYCYYYMFYGCTSLTAAPVLSATSLAKYSYGYMFYGCTSLTTPPELNTTKLVEYCYIGMFYGCASLTAAPSLPATTLADSCYYYMFRDCTSLTEAPALNATTLAKYCYAYMFQGCTNLTAPPELKAKTLADYCYSYMFYGCTNMTTPPALPATSLAQYCYSNMFNGCTKLATPPELKATTLASGCYNYMFRDCASMAEAPALPATSLTDSCYNYMFRGCISLTTAPELKATTMSQYGYRGMFYGCTNLMEAPALSATTLAQYCYAYMFYGCASLAESPDLRAATLANYCYNYMFYGCASLTTPPELAATALANYCYSNMFAGCTNLTSITKLPATTLSGYCYTRMFAECPNIKLSDEPSDEYHAAYTIPANGATGTAETSSLTNMFYGTGGTFTGTPSINTTYYTSNNVI